MAYTRAVPWPVRWQQFQLARTPLRLLMAYQATIPHSVRALVGGPRFQSLHAPSGGVAAFAARREVTARVVMGTSCSNRLVSAKVPGLGVVASSKARSTRLRSSESDESSVVASEDDEEYIVILEAAYADQEEATKLQERMQNDTAFRIRIKAAMGNELYRERLTAAIQKSPHMQRAIQQSPAMQELQKQTENNPLLQPFQDEKVLDQLEALQGDPRKTAMMMTQSEVKLKSICADLVLGVEEYRDDFGEDADDLIMKFDTIANQGYKAFLKIAMEDTRVQNAVINALMDAMEEEQAAQREAEESA